MATAMKPFFYGILSRVIFIKKYGYIISKKNNTVPVFKRKPILQIRPEAEVIKICFLIETHKQISM